jgi:uncharacterized protein DUF6152
MKLSLAFLALGLGLMTVNSALAHHSFAAEFDGNKPIRIQGTLSKMEWTNPHSWFYVDVKDDSGNVATWGCEGASPIALSRQGFQKGAAKLGDKLVVDGYAAKDGSHLMNARRIYLNEKLIFEQKGEGQ